MRRTLTTFALMASIGLPAVALAQEADEAGFLERQLQNILGGEGREVRISGLQGALSSEATIAEIEIADDDGVWLSVRDVALDWRRVALLRGRLEVEALTVGIVDIVRPPLPAPGAPPAVAADSEAQPFALPELPVSVNVDQLSVGALILGEDVVGTAAQLSINGSAALAGGTGRVDLSAVRIDGHDSSYGIVAGFDNETRQTVIDVALREAEDGLIGTVANIPGAPPLSLSVEGDAPLGDFTARIDLTTDGQQRLAGTVSIADTPEGPADRRIAADVAGDVAPLFLPDYQDFFGNRVALTLEARQGAEFGVAVEDFALETRGLDLRGTARLNAGFLPETVDVTGRIGTDSGLPVVLPLAGPPVVVPEADLSLTYDAEAGDSFALQVDGDGIQRADGLLIDRLSLVANGSLTKAGPTEVTGANAIVTAALEGFSTTDPALYEAVGDAVLAEARVDWSAGGELRLAGLDMRAGDVTASGRATLTGIETGAIDVQAALDAEVGDLSRFAALAGQPLGGAISADVAADYDLVSGAFDVTLDGQSRDLRVGAPEADGLLAGVVDLDVAAARDADGLRLDRLQVDGARIALDGEAAIGADGLPRRARLEGRIGDPGGQPVVLPVPEADITLQGADLDLFYDAEAGEAARLDLALRDLSVPGTLRVGEMSVAADGTLAQADGRIDAVTGDLTARVDGVTAPDRGLARALEPGLSLAADADWTRAEDTLTLRNLDVTSGALSLAGLGAVEGLAAGAPAGRVDLRLDSGDLARFAALAGQDLAGRVTGMAEASYDMGTGFFDIDVDVDGRDVRAGIAQVDQVLRGPSEIVVRARRDEDGMVIERAAIDTAELDLVAEGGMDTGGATTIDIDGGLRDMSLLLPGFTEPLSVDATLTSPDLATWQVDGTLDGPIGLAARYEGIVAQPDGALDLDAQADIPLALANVFIAPRTLEGAATLDVSVDGAPGLDTLDATLAIDGARAADPGTRLALEDIAARIDVAGGTARIDMGGALSSGGRIEVAGPVTLSGDFPAQIDVALRDLLLTDPRLYEARLGGDISMTGPLLNGAEIAGRIDVGRSEINISGSMGGGGTIIDVQHRGLRAEAERTLRFAGLIADEEEEAAGGGGGGPAYPLDILISAPQEIFVRGRGLNVELGGEIEVGGTTAAPLPTGSLELIRGRLDLLSRQLTFDTARISLQGDFEPDLELIARSSNGGVTSFISIAGPVGDPEIEFYAQPELPEDEVLSQLFFGKPLQDLTPLELAQLGTAINRLTGGGRGGPLAFARESLGIDQLAIGTDEEGGATVTAGRYITENLYSDVTVNEEGQSEIQLNYELRQDFTVRGGFTNEGDTGVGFAFERDY